MNKETKYIGITIGPIYKTLAQTEKTREIWGGSYLFSWLCKKLIKAIITPGTGITSDDIILPSPELVDEATPGVGLYPDRIIIRSKEGNYDTVLTAILNVKTKLAERILESILHYNAYDPYARLFENQIQKRENEVKEVLKSYFQVYSLEVSASDLQLKDDKNNPLGPIKCINLYLDHLELRNSIAGFDPDPIKAFLRGINHTFLLKEAFNTNFDHFPSLPEISSTEIRFIKENHTFKFRSYYDSIAGISLESAKSIERHSTLLELYNRKLKSELSEALSFDDFIEDDLLNKIFSITGISDHLRTYHKYVAIIHADGDRMGTLIGSLKSDGDQSEIKNFSKDLIDFSIAANMIIAGYRFTQGNSDEWGYGGAPVYIGGDDLVFFAPVASLVEKNGKQEFQTVFHLIHEIDQKFNEIFNTSIGGNYVKYPKISADFRPCISYGISFTYIKHPLKESFEFSRDLMYFVKSDTYKTRNRINFRVQKHSGQWFGGIIDKNFTESFDGIMNLLTTRNKNALTLLRGESELFINSVGQKLTQYETTIISCSNSPESIQALFDNIFNEPIHERFRNYLNEICNLLTQMLMEYPKEISDSNLRNERIKEVIQTVHGILRFIHFIRDNEFRN